MAQDPQILKAIGKLFRDAREAESYSQEDFAKDIDVKQPHLSRIELGKSPPGPEMLESFRKVTKDEARYQKIRALLKRYHGWDDAGDALAAEQAVDYSAKGRFPKAGRSAMGRFVEAIENEGRPFATEKKFTEPWLDAAELGSDAAFAVDVDGDSMEPTILDGSEVLVDPKADLRDGDIAWVWFEGKSTVKRWTKKKNALVLRPDNPKHEAIILTSEEWKSGNGIAYRVVASRLSKRH